MNNLTDCQSNGDNGGSAVVNFGNGRRHKSVDRDAQFWPDFQAVWAAQSGSAGEHSSVNSHTPSSPSSSSQPSTSSTATGTPKPSTLASVDADLAALFPEELQVAAAFDDYMQRQPRAGLHRYKAPAAWRDLGLPMRSLYLHRTLAAGGPVAAFSLRLSKEVEASARTQPSALSWLLKRVRYHLNAMLERDVPVWFIVEQDFIRPRGMHLHGELAAGDHELKLVRKALRLAGGEWHKVRQHQAHTKFDPDEGWIAYVLKEHAITRKAPRHVPADGFSKKLEAMRGFNGGNTACTRSIGAQARLSYEADRLAVLAFG